MWMQSAFSVQKRNLKKEKTAKPFILRLLAFPARLERAAFRLGGERSILLSYRNKYKDLFNFYAVP